MAKRTLITFAIISISIGFMTLMLSRFSVDTSLSEWHSGFDGFVKANRIQQVEQKPMLLFFYTDWCQNCEALRENVLSTQTVKEFSQSIIPVKINPEIGALENQIAEDFGVRGYPTLIVVTHDQKAKMVNGIAGKTPQEFVQKCQFVIDSLTL